MKTYIQELLGGSLVILVGTYGLFVAFEPAMLGAIEDQFVVSQTVTAEITFATPATDVTLSPSLAGITGGTSNGGTQVVVRTNNSTGYTMTLTASSSLGMIGALSPTNVIPAFVPTATGVPNFSFDSGTVAANKAFFAYTVEASSTAELDASFKDNGSACNTGSGDTADKCWLNASTTAETIMATTASTTASGSTSTIKFRVVMQPNPSPAITEDVYYATTTLTATNN